jgi:hypothetical protein
MVKVKLFLCLTKYHTMKTYEDTEVQFLAFILAIDGVEWSASRFSSFTPGIKLQVFIIQEAGWASEPLFMLWRRERSLASAEN